MYFSQCLFFRTLTDIGLTTVVLFQTVMLELRLLQMAQLSCNGYNIYDNELRVITSSGNCL